MNGSIEKEVVLTLNMTWDEHKKLHWQLHKVMTEAKVDRQDCPYTVVELRELLTLLYQSQK